MPDYGQIIGKHKGNEGTWLVELDDDGMPRSPEKVIPTAALPDVVPGWTLMFPIPAEDGMVFTDDETAAHWLMLMRRRMSERKGDDLGS